jgi:hypothetical protein
MLQALNLSHKSGRLRSQSNFHAEPLIVSSLAKLKAKKLTSGEKIRHDMYRKPVIVSPNYE